jgi:hypothetical protein
LFYWDLAQNIVSTGRGSYGIIFGDGFTLENTVNVAGGLLGLSPYSLGPLKRLIDGAPPKSGELLDATISLGVKVGGPVDKVGHAFVVLDMPDGEKIVKGFYPREGLDLKSGRTILEFFFKARGGMLGRLSGDADLLDKPGVLLQRFEVSTKDLERAAEFIADFDRRVISGLEYYHIDNQCAVFAKAVLREAGVRPFIPIEYPPLIHAILLLRMFL